MRKLLSLLLIIYSYVAIAQEEIKEVRCATEEYHKIQMARLGISKKALSSFRTESVTFSGIIAIPVVVHVVHNQADGAIGGSNNANITQEQILSQIKVLNEDYRKKSGTNGFNTNPVGADIGIEFALAKIDPNCNPTNGITRHYSETLSFDPFTNEVKKYDPWPGDQYLNIWVCKVQGNYLGLAQYPNYSGLPGLSDNEGDEITDGITIKHTAFGSKTGTASDPNGLYTYGRTATHEIGHWLGLIHTWGDATCGTDYCRDTPYERDSNTGACNTVISDCDSSFGEKVMIENYLDYSPDICMNIFTQNQKARMWQTMTTSPSRVNILKYIKDGVNEKTIAPPVASFPLFQDFENETLEIADVSSNCKGLKSAVRSANSTATGYFMNTQWVNNTQNSNYTIDFDYAYPTTRNSDTLFIYGYSGCQTGKFIITSFTGDSLVTSQKNSDNFSPTCKEWKSKSISFTSTYPYFDIQFETNKVLSSNLYIDNIAINQFGFSSTLQTKVFGNPVAKVLAGYNIENQKITLEVLFSTSSDVEFELIDMLGKRIYTQTAKQAFPGIFEIPVYGLPTGIYLVKTKVKDEIVMTKVMVI